MNGSRPVRVIMTSGGMSWEIPGVRNAEVRIQPSDLPMLTLDIFAEISIRPAFPQEIDGETDP